MGAWADKAGLQPLLPQQCPPESWASLGFSVSCPELTAYMGGSSGAPLPFSAVRAQPAAKDRGGQPLRVTLQQLTTQWGLGTGEQS